jgi:hypothetical protein
LSIVFAKFFQKYFQKRKIISEKHLTKKKNGVIIIPEREKRGALRKRLTG